MPVRGDGIHGHSATFQLDGSTHLAFILYFNVAHESKLIENTQTSHDIIFSYT